nr:uncharacterized mitochondrial protein AtMg00810-like [Tanacetum cinerariifolium]
MQTQTSNTLYNAIIEAGSKDRPPMLAPGNYVQWKSRIKRYIDTKPNHELIHYCLKNPPYELGWIDKEIPISEGSPITRSERFQETYKNVSQEIRDQLNAKAEAVQIILTRIDNDIYSTVDACPNACEMWKAIERFYKMMNEIIRNQCKVTSHQVNVQFLLQLQPEWQRIARVANPLTLVAQQQPVYHPKTHPTHYTQNSLTRSQQAATRNRGKAIGGKARITEYEEIDVGLLDESQVMLRVPRNNNMYIVDLKYVAPSGGLTCLFAKATLDESNLWHRRLGRINFKTINKLEAWAYKFQNYEQTGKGKSYKSKAFRVFNSRTRIVEETLHINYLEKKPNVTGSGPTWLFDIDTLTKSMNYKPVVAGNQSNGNAGTNENIDAGQAGNSASIMDNAIDKNIVYGCADDPNMPNLEEIVYSDDDEIIFKYLKGQPKLGLWYPKDSPFDLEAYTNSDYAGASLDRKSRIGDETVHEEMGDRVESDSTTASSLKAEQNSGNIHKTQSMATLNEPIPQGTGTCSGPRCQDTILGDIPAQTRREPRGWKRGKSQELHTSRGEESQEVGKEEKVKNSTPQEEEDASNQGKNIADFDQNEGISFIQKDAETQGRYGHGIEVNTASTSITTTSINITTAEPVTTVGAPVTTAGVSVSTAEPSTPPPITTTGTEDKDLITAQTLMKMRSEKSKEKSKERGSKEKSSETATRPTRRVIMKEASDTTTRLTIPPQQQLNPKDKGKGKMVEPKKPLKKKDQIEFDKEVGQRLQSQLQAKLEEEERMARQKEKDVNIAEWDDVQAMMDVDHKLAERLQA